jgi:hypothetical protein
MRFRCYLLAFFIAAAWFVAAPGGAQAAGCKAPRDAADFVVNVSIDVGQPNVYNQLSKAQLGTSNAHGRRRQVLGTTQSGVELRWAIKYQLREWRNVYCFWVASADVQISYQQLDVNIAAEYEPGSCQYEAVLDHEFEHVDVAQKIMSPYAQQIKQALTTLAIPTANLPSVANSPAIAREEVEEVFRHTLHPVRDKMIQVLAENQAEVDTIENYRRTWQRCRRW